MSNIRGNKGLFKKDYGGRTIMGRSEQFFLKDPRYQFSERK
jgi:hypothetical protein